jgi:sigma-B regulation protein RsbU (phosphoserine phosphatase)
LSDSGPIEEDLEDLYQNAPCGYLSLQPDGRIVKTNQTFCRWTGYSPDELIGKRLQELLNIAGRIFFETHFAPLLRMQGFFNEVALDLVKKDGEALPVLVNAAERTSVDGKPQFIRLTVFNATDRRRYERELLKAATS